MTKNQKLKTKVEEVASLAVALQTLLATLNREDRELPDFYFDLFNRQLRFQGADARKVGAAFGPGGWTRKQSGAETDWVKVLEGGLAVIIQKAESTASLDVPPSAFGLPPGALGPIRHPLAREVLA